MAASVIGMGLRWLSHRFDRKEKEALGARTRQADDPAPGQAGDDVEKQTVAKRLRVSEHG